MTATTTEQPAAKSSHVPAELVAKRRAEKAARLHLDPATGATVLTPSAKPAAPKAKRPAKAAKTAKPAGRTDAARAADKARTLDRIDPERMRSALAESHLTIAEAATAVGRSVSLVRGWLGTPGQIRNGKATNPPLAAHRLKEVERTWMAAGKAKAKAAAKVAK